MDDYSCYSTNYHAEYIPYLDGEKLSMKNFFLVVTTSKLDLMLYDELFFLVFLY